MRRSCWGWTRAGGLGSANSREGFPDRGLSPRAELPISFCSEGSGIPGNKHMGERACLYLMVEGFVQGVGFRFFTERMARGYGLSGYVRNLPNGWVEIEVEGEDGALNAFLEDVRRGPALSRVTKVNVEQRPLTGRYTEFEVRI